MTAPLPSGVETTVVSAPTGEKWRVPSADVDALVKDKGYTVVGDGGKTPTTLENVASGLRQVSDVATTLTPMLPLAAVTHAVTDAADPANLTAARGAGAGTALSRSAEDALTSGILGKARDAISEQTGKNLEKLEADHPVASGMGTAIGTAAQFAALSPAAGAAGEAAAARAPSGILNGAARFGAEGAVQSLPGAAKALIDGDPAKAAEYELAGIGMGGLLGGAFSGATRAAVKGAMGLDPLLAGKVAPYLSENAEALASRGTGLAGKITKGAAKGAGGLLGGLPGYVVGEGLGSVLKPGAEALASRAEPFAQKLIEGLSSKLAAGDLALGTVLDVSQRIAKVPSFVAKMGTSLSFADHAPHPAPSLPKFPVSETTKLTQIDEQAKEAAGDPVAYLAQLGAHLPPELATSAQLLAGKQLQYVASIVPPAPPPQPFAPKVKQQLTPTDAARLRDALEVWHDPFCVLDHAKDGTLTAEHVKALNALYPGIASGISGALQLTAAGKDAPVLRPAQQKALLALFGPTMAPPATAAAAAPQPTAAGAKRTPKVPAPRKINVKLPDFTSEMDRVAAHGVGKR